MEKRGYELLLSHEFPLIIAELTSYGEAQKHIPWSDKEFSFSPFCIFEGKSGMLSYIYDPKGIEWKIEQAGHFDREVMKSKTLELFNIVKDTILSERALSREELIVFLDQIKNSWTWWDCMWWMIEYYDKHKLPMEDVLAVRKETEYMGPGIAGTIRNSLRKIFPGYEKYVDVISIAEVRDNKLEPIKVLENRLRNYVVIDQKIEYSLSEVLSRENIILKQEKIDSSLLKGQVAYKGGVIKGSVRRVENRDQVAEFQEGEILVSSTTTPDFISAMKKARAILSEHGGAICHASITSRELKIPCVVGIKGITSVLKTGDIVEVDADKGIVKILN